MIIDTKASGKNATITCDEKATFYYVDKDGKITEEGTHDALIAQGGEYAKLYEIQSCWYRKDYLGGNAI